MVTVQRYAPPAKAAFLGLLVPIQNQFPQGKRRFIHEAEDFVVFMPTAYKKPLQGRIDEQKSARHFSRRKHHEAGFVSPGSA
jgi:hypothetical protein